MPERQFDAIAWDTELEENEEQHEYGQFQPEEYKWMNKYFKSLDLKEETNFENESLQSINNFLLNNRHIGREKFTRHIKDAAKIGVEPKVLDMFFNCWRVEDLGIDSAERQRLHEINTTALESKEDKKNNELMEFNSIILDTRNKLADDGLLSKEEVLKMLLGASVE